MKQIKLLLMLLVMVGLAPATLAEEERSRCTGDTQECLDAMARNLRSRGWVGLELESEGGLEEMIVTRVVPGSPAEAAGFHEGDRLVALNGVEFEQANIKKLKAMREDLTPGKQVTYRVQRKGSVRELWVTLTAVPDAVVAEWIGRHMMQHTSPHEDED
jgi:predicted metalloprotease with PDZ domain